MLKFCTKCDNLYDFTTATDTEGKKSLVLICKQCAHQEPTDASVLSHSVLVANKHQYPVNPDVIYDPSLPRTRLLECPNDACPSRSTDTNPEVVYYNYNKDMQLVYVCSECKHYWLKK